MKLSLGKIQSLSTMISIMQMEIENGKVQGLPALVSFDFMEIGDDLNKKVEFLKKEREKMLENHNGTDRQIPIEGTPMFSLETEFKSKKDEERFNKEFERLLKSEREIPTLRKFEKSDFAGASGEFFLQFFQVLKSMDLIVATKKKKPEEV